MTRRRPVQYASLTSLMDVLFILVFASLAAGSVRNARAAAKAQARAHQAKIRADAGAPRARVAAGTSDAAPATGVDGGAAAVAADDARLRRRAVAELQHTLADKNAIIARVAKRGVLTSIDVEEDGHTRRVHVGVPLVERVADADVGAAYLGDRSPALRVCAIVRAQLGRRDLGGDLVVIVPEVPLADLTVALVHGLRQDEERCMTDNGIGVIVDPGQAAETAP